MDNSIILEKSVSIVNERLRKYFEELKAEIFSEYSKAIDLAKIVEDYTLRGGKRLRATLVLVGYWSKEWGKEISDVVDIMAAIELLQSYLLIHDDIMDRDELRRGGPTAHVMFRNICLEKNWRECDHYGVSQAIVAGDLLEASAVGLLASRVDDQKVLRDLIYTYSSGLRRVAYGQYLDVMFSQLRLGEINENDVILVYKLKTSSYTVELPLHLGAIYSGKYSKDLLLDLSRYAIPAGIAFQARDDIIGLYGDPSVTGKPAGSDVKSKKKTLLIIKSYELSSEKDRAFLKKIYDELPSHQITDEHVIEVQRIVRDSGALQYVEELIDKKSKEALNALDESREICEEAKNFLRWLIYKLSHREK